MAFVRTEQAMRASLSDQLKLEVRTLHGDIKASSATHPVNFDDVWHLAGYSRKDNAKRALNGPGIDGEIVLQQPPSGSATRGRRSTTILLTFRAFKHLCMKARSEQGWQVCKYYYELEDNAHNSPISLVLADLAPEVLSRCMAAHDERGREICIHVVDREESLCNALGVSSVDLLSASRLSDDAKQSIMPLVRHFGP